MKKILLAPALAFAILSMGAAAPAVSSTDTVLAEPSAPPATRVLVYRCWSYNTLGQTWYGQHQNWVTARRLAITACVNNTPRGQLCYHNTNPCEELYL